MIDYILFWLGRILAELALGFVLAAIVLAFFAVLELHKRLVQYHCKHERTYENASFQEVCTKCSKNLGFIGRQK